MHLVRFSLAGGRGRAVALKRKRRRETFVPRRHDDSVDSRSAVTFRSSRIRSNPRARPSRRRRGTRRHSTRKRMSRTRRCPCRSSRSSHTSDSRHSDCHRVRAPRTRGPALPRERNCSWDTFLCMRKLNGPLHVTTRERGEDSTPARLARRWSWQESGQRAVADSVPPNAKEDPRRADRRCEHGRHVLPARTESRWHTR